MHTLAVLTDIEKACDKVWKRTESKATKHAGVCENVQMDQSLP